MTAFSQTLTESTFVSDSLSVTLTTPLSETGMGLSESMTRESSGGAFLNRDVDDTIGISDSLSVQTGWAEPDGGFYLTDSESAWEVTDTLTETAGTTDPVTVKFPVNRPDDNLSLTDSMSVSMHYVRTITETLGITDSLQYDGQVTPPPPLTGSGVYLFTPPTVKEHPIGGGRLFGFYGMHRGISVLITNGVVVEKRWPTTDDVAAADTVYLGGHEYYLNAADAAVLENAGYGANLTAVDVYIDEYTGSY